MVFSPLKSATPPSGPALERRCANSVVFSGRRLWCHKRALGVFASNRLIISGAFAFFSKPCHPKTHSPASREGSHADGLYSRESFTGLLTRVLTV